MSNELRSKIVNILNKPQIMSFATMTEDGKPWARYVVGVADDDLTIRFSTFLSSRKVTQIKKNQEVHILCGVSTIETASHYLQIQGRADVTQDKEECAGFWHDDLKAYFSGPDDPNYCICLVKPYRIEYYTMNSQGPEVWEG